MPTYEYECSACSAAFTREQKITEPPDPQCPTCGEPKAKRLISKTTFTLKGKGWFKDGY